MHFHAMLIMTECLHRIPGSGAIRLEGNDEQSKNQDNHCSQGEDPPAQGGSIGKILKPAAHGIIDERNGRNKGQQNPFYEILAE